MVKKFKTIDSTNNESKNCINSSSYLDDVNLIYADNQTSGRGSKNNTWDSTSDDIYMSVFFEELKIPYGVLMMKIALIVKKIVDKYDLKSSIKWPNDIFVNDKKICGILCEKVVKRENNSSRNYYIVGIGLNVNRKNNTIVDYQRRHIDEDFVSYIINIRKVTSLYLEKNVEYDKEKIIFEIYEEVKKFITFINNTTISDNKFYNSIHDDYLKEICDTHLRYCMIDESNSVIYDSIIKNINLDGSIVLEDTTNNKINVYSFEQIKIIS